MCQILCHTLTSGRRVDGGGRHKAANPMTTVLDCVCERDIAGYFEADLRFAFIKTDILSCLE